MGVDFRTTQTYTSNVDDLSSNPGQSCLQFTFTYAIGKSMN